MSAAEYPIPAARWRVEETIERSRFIATIAHAPTSEEAKAFIDDLRREFADANHNCWAYVAGPPGSTTAIGLSDAGEPHGTAGRPMLDILLYSGVGEIAAVVTRYFGGVKLGKGGLVRAYGGAVQRALATLPTVLRIERVAVSVTVGYQDVELLRRLFAEVGAEVTAESYGETVLYEAAVPVSRVAELERSLMDRTAGRAAVTRGGPSAT
jgi:uncharacterized YigZ family protein